MPNQSARLHLSRAQILAFRRRTNLLDQRRQLSANSLRQAAWAGLQDSMPRAALLSLHARVNGIRSEHWEHPSLVQIWGPRYSVYVLAACDLPVFSLGRLPASAAGRDRAQRIAARLHTYLEGRRMPFDQAGRAMGMHPNSLRYAAATGTVLIRWSGALKSDIWTVPAPVIDPQQARMELARRYLHIFGPSTAAAFGKWAGIRPPEARLAFDPLAKELTPVRTPLGDAWMLAANTAEIKAVRPDRPASARLLPSGDTYYLLWGADRELLVPEARHRAALWTSRVWPGAVLVSGEIAGTWRRAGADISIQLWRRLAPAELAALEAEVAALPLPGLTGPMRIQWT